MTRISYFSVIEREHTIQNPVGPDGLDRVADYLGVSDGQRVLDVGCGKAWMLVRWARRWAIRGTGLEINPDFVAAAEHHASEAGVRDRLELVTGDARSYLVEPATWDVVTCIGASFALDGFDPAVKWMASAVRPGGTVAIGEIYTDNVADLMATLDWNGLEPVGLVPATLQDWDHYESQHWQSAWTWAQENPDHPERDWLLARAGHHRDEYLRVHRGRLHWAVLIGVKR